MKQGKLFRNIFLVGMAFTLFLMSSCDTPNNNTPNNKPDDKAKAVTITKVTIADQEFDVSTSKDITLPSGVESFTANDVKNVKGKVEGKGAEIVLDLDKIEPTQVNATEQGVDFTLHTKATKEYKAGKITLKALKATSGAKDVTVTYEVENAADGQKHGSMAVVKGTNAVTNNSKVKVGDTLTAAASPANGYEVEEWKINNVKKEGATSNILTVKVGDEHVTAGLKITVKFKSKTSQSEAKDVTVTYEVENAADGQKHGSMAVLNSNGFKPVQNGGKVKVNDTLRIQATPDADYELEEWKINGTKVNKTGLNISVKAEDAHATSGLEITVKFKSKTQNPPTTTVVLTYKVQDASKDHGTLTAKIENESQNLSDGTANVTKGATDVFTATPKTEAAGKKYKVGQWFVAGQAVQGEDGKTEFKKQIDEAVTVEVSFVEES